MLSNANQSELPVHQVLQTMHLNGFQLHCSNLENVIRMSSIRCLCVISWMMWPWFDVSWIDAFHASKYFRDLNRDSHWNWNLTKVHSLHCCRCEYEPFASMATTTRLYCLSMLMIQKIISISYFNPFAEMCVPETMIHIHSVQMKKGKK